MVSIYGYKLLRERFSGPSGRYLEELDKSQYLSNSEIIALQEKQFVKLAKDAVENTPFYRDWAREQGFTKDDIKNIKDINRFPIINKLEIINNLNKFISEKYINKSLICLNTSGTSGSPLSVYCNSDVRTKHYAFFSRLRKNFGLGKKSKRATLFGRIIMRPEVKDPPFWRYDILNNNLLMSSYHLSEDNLKYYYDKLVDFNPDEIIGYPSSIYQIALHICKTGKPVLNPRVVFTTAETLLAHQREIIESAFSSPVIDQYGCTEMVLFAAQCECGTMHLHDEHGIVEVKENSDERLSTEGRGSIVVTGLLNYVMPMIRYEIGDVGSIRRGSCDCGRNFTILDTIEGRIDDIVYTADGRPVGRLDPIFKGGIGVDEAQIIQRADGSIDIFVVSNEKFTIKNKRWLDRQARTRIGGGVAINIIDVDRLEKNSNGKFKSVISYYRPS
jgi:phenylacetate-CoA ligase